MMMRAQKRMRRDITITQCRESSPATRFYHRDVDWVHKNKSSHMSSSISDIKEFQEQWLDLDIMPLRW